MSWPSWPVVIVTSTRTRDECVLLDASKHRYFLFRVFEYIMNYCRSWACQPKLSQNSRCSLSLRQELEHVEKAVMLICLIIKDLWNDSLTALYNFWKKNDHTLTFVFENNFIYCLNTSTTKQRGKTCLEQQDYNAWNISGRVSYACM